MSDFLNSIATRFQLWWAATSENFYSTFIAQNRWKLFSNGLIITLEVTLCAAILGVLLGFIIAVIRSTYDKTPKHGFVLRLLNGIARLYLTVIRGTPTLVQLMIMYFIIFASSNNKVLAAVFAFGMNSAAYVAEIIRSGIMSIDPGQFEAGRSLGFTYARTMVYIIMPQALKNVLPALANEVITLLKETSVSAMVGLTDITYAGNLIRSRTYEAFFPLIAVAAIYLILVMILEYITRFVERRMRNYER